MAAEPAEPAAPAVPAARAALASRAASCWPATAQAPMSTANDTAYDPSLVPGRPASHSATAASGGYSKPKSRYGSCPPTSRSAYVR